jgi:hypothetical protein
MPRCLRIQLDQPLGNLRFYAKIERATGMRREARARGRLRLEDEPAMPVAVARNAGTVKQMTLTPLIPRLIQPTKYPEVRRDVRPIDGKRDDLQDLSLFARKAAWIPV